MKTRAELQAGMRKREGSRGQRKGMWIARELIKELDNIAVLIEQGNHSEVISRYGTDGLKLLLDRLAIELKVSE